MIQSLTPIQEGDSVTLVCRYNSSNPVVTSYRWSPPGSGRDTLGVLTIQKVTWNSLPVKCAACNHKCSWASPVSLNVHCECQGCAGGVHIEICGWESEGMGTETTGHRRGLGEHTQGSGPRRRQILIEGTGSFGDIKKGREPKHHLRLWPCRRPQSREDTEDEPQTRDPRWAACRPPV